MTDWNQVTTAIEGAIGTLLVVAPIAIGAYFKIKAMINAAKAEAAKNSAINSARIDQHDILQGVTTVPNGAQSTLTPRAPVQPMPALPQSKIQTVKLNP